MLSLRLCPAPAWSALGSPRTSPSRRALAPELSGGPWASSLPSPAAPRRRPLRRNDGAAPALLLAVHPTCRLLACLPAYRLPPPPPPPPSRGPVRCAPSAPPFYGLLPVARTQATLRSRQLLARCWLRWLRWLSWLLTRLLSDLPAAATCYSTMFFRLCSSFLHVESLIAYCFTGNTTVPDEVRSTTARRKNTLKRPLPLRGSSESSEAASRISRQSNRLEPLEPNSASSRRVKQQQSKPEEQGAEEE